ncbi:MAG: hypothetical protein AAGE59_14160 [Cyanobacteria bacterium P01_F01_bin.86]
MTVGIRDDRSLTISAQTGLMMIAAIARSDVTQIASSLPPYNG